MQVHYIDVGQGDATFIQGPDFSMLIDAGRHTANDVIQYLNSIGVKNIDVVVGTHPHADHIGQIDKVIQAFNVEEVWMSGDMHTTQTFERVMNAIENNGVGYNEPRAGEVYDIGSLIVEVLNPSRLTGDFHEGSVSLRLIFGEVAFVFTGDAERLTELEIIGGGYDVQAQVLQMGHHGSTTSSIEEFLKSVDPEVAIYSAGKDNRYGHPHQEVLERVTSLNIALYGTDVHGTIIITTDGNIYSVSTQKSD